MGDSGCFIIGQSVNHHSKIFHLKKILHRFNRKIKLFLEFLSHETMRVFKLPLHEILEILEKSLI